MLNKVILMGRLTADPELRQTTSGISNCRFTVAVQRSFAAKGEERQSDFITVVAWRQTAEFVAKYFAKGKMIIVEGNLRTGSYMDKKFPEVKHYTTEVFADNVSFGEPKGGGNGDYSNNTGNETTNFPIQKPSVSEDSTSLAIGNLNEFEEILGDGQLPF